MNYYISEKSIIGTREEQQDNCCFRATDNAVFAVVCDGMGGTAGGAAASRIAMEKLKELYESKDIAEAFPDFFLRTIDILDESVVKLQKESLETSGAGTTIAAVAIENKNLYWLSIGDSRLYILRGNEIVQVTRDHNFALSLEQLTESERQEVLNKQGGKHRSDALISFIGIGGVKIYDINESGFRLQDGDKILLTTDGLTKLVEDTEILTTLKNSLPKESLKNLFDTATKKTTESQDNTTCVLIQIRNEEEFLNGGK